MKHINIHFIDYMNGMLDGIEYYKDAIIFDDKHIGFTVLRLPQEYDLYINTHEYANDNHRVFKTKFINPVLDDRGYIANCNYGIRFFTVINGIEISYVISNEFNINFEQGNGK